MIVVKVGGSLFDHPRLGPGLQAYLDSLAPAEVLLVPGGGVAVDAVRHFDRVHGLGEEEAHWLALKSLVVTANLLERIISSAKVLDCFAFAAEDESLPGKLPHSWEVTSDSIAARVAVVYAAERLVLLKSVDVPPGSPWEEVSERGWVDAYFPHVIAGAPFPVEVVNFRQFLDSLSGEIFGQGCSPHGQG